MAFLSFGAHLNPFNLGGHLGIFNSPTTANFSGMHPAAFNPSTSFGIHPLSFTDFAHFGSHVHSAFGSINTEQSHLPQSDNPFFGSSGGSENGLFGAGAPAGPGLNPSNNTIDLAPNGTVASLGDGAVGNHTINGDSLPINTIYIDITTAYPDHVNTINDGTAKTTVNLFADFNGQDVINNNPSGSPDIANFTQAKPDLHVTINDFTGKDFLEFNAAEQSTLHVTQNGTDSVRISDTLDHGTLVLTINATSNLTAANFIADFVHII